MSYGEKWAVPMLTFKSFLHFSSFINTEKNESTKEESSLCSMTSYANPKKQRLSCEAAVVKLLKTR